MKGELCELNERFEKEKVQNDDYKLIVLKRNTGRGLM